MERSVQGVYPSPGGLGKGHGTRVGSGGLPWGFWFLLVLLD